MSTFYGFSAFNNTLTTAVIISNAWSGMVYKVKMEKRESRIKLSHLDNEKEYFVIPSNSNTFSDWGRTCHVSLVKIH